jgi:hypothetical protein
LELLLYKCCVSHWVVPGAARCAGFCGPARVHVCLSSAFVHRRAMARLLAALFCPRKVHPMPSQPCLAGCMARPCLSVRDRYYKVYSTPPPVPPFNPMSPGPQATLSNWEEEDIRPSITVGPHWEMTTQALVGFLYIYCRCYMLARELTCDTLPEPRLGLTPRWSSVP